MQTDRQKALKWWNELGENHLLRIIKQGELTTKHFSFDRKRSSLTGREIEEVWKVEKNFDN